jgi:hypothetical protein
VDGLEITLHPKPRVGFQLDKGFFRHSPLGFRVVRCVILGKQVCDPLVILF